MEATYIKGWYEAATGEAESSRETFKTLTTKYSDIPIFWLHSGILKSGQRGSDIKDAISDLEKCLEVLNTGKNEVHINRSIIEKAQHSIHRLLEFTK